MAILFPRYAGEEIDPRRRRLLVAALRAGLLGGATTLLPAHTASAAWFGSSPEKLPETRSVYSIEGEATVNGRPADLSTRIGSGDRVQTGERSKIVFAHGSNAHILRENSSMVLPEEESGVADLLRVVTGALLSVFGRNKLQIATPTATVGIRGTGVYVEADPDESYICTCFGMADLTPVDATVPEESVVSEHHDAPRFATRAASAGKRIRVAPFRNHTDVEVALIEALVGRVPPFAFTLDRFDSPLQSY